MTDRQFAGDTVSLGALGDALVDRWRTLMVCTVMGVGAGFSAVALIPATYSARVVLLPPQPQNGGAASALGSLGALAGLTSASGRNTAEQYVALMGSTNVLGRLVDEFGLMQVYDEELRTDAIRELEKRASFNVGKKDGLITVEVEDHDAQRSAKLANAFVAELRRMTNMLAVTEAQQRRVFFEARLQEAKAGLTQAQINLQASGYNPGALKVEPKAAAEGYARLRAEVTSAQVKLQGLRQGLADSAPEVAQQQALISALKSELMRLEQSYSGGESVEGLSRRDGSADYITRYREFKYQDSLFEMFARQYESARVDESREGALIQVVDAAVPPERRIRPKRLVCVGGGAVAGFGLATIWVLMRQRRRIPESDVKV